MPQSAIPLRTAKYDGPGKNDGSGKDDQSSTPTPVNLPYAITGIPTTPGKKGQVPIRQDCDTWSESEPAQKNLFLLALRFYVDMDPLDRDSFWQTAGIHGMPYMPWNESTLPQSVPILGYCTHNSSLFPSWHRPYVALFEQRIYEIMVNNIIPTQMYEKDHVELEAAAKAWRLPYWDWAANNQVPLLAQEKEVQVTTKFGTSPIKNPLYQYDLPEGKTFGTMGPPSNQTYVLTSADGLPWELPVATGRCPPTFGADAAAFEAGTVNNAQVAENIKNHEWYSETADDPTLSESVYRLLTYDVPYEVFATTNMNTSDTDPLTYLNCEYIHNNVHNWIGGNAGQMGDVPVAAYDPIFFLHHCNIDRLYAIWQTLYPTKWFRLDNIHPDNGTWSIPTGRPDTQCTQLAPFRPNLSGIYYTPDTVREWMRFGYTYPELQPWKYKSKIDYLTSIYTDIIKYRVTADEFSDWLSKSQDAWGGLVLNRCDRDKNIVVHHDYVINVRYGKYDLGGLPYEIQLYLRRERAHPPNSPGLVPPPSLDSKKASFIGSVYNFSTATGPQGTNSNCPNCAIQQAKETFSNAQIPITSILAKVAQDESWPVNTIAPDGSDGMLKFLEGRLTWKVVKKGGEEVQLELLPNLRVSVAVGTAKHEKHFDERPSVYEGYEAKHSITHNYLGGLQHGESY